MREVAYISKFAYRQISPCVQGFTDHAKYLPSDGVFLDFSSVF